MRVNSVFKRSFNHGKLVGPLLLVIFLTASSFTKPSDRESRSKHVNLLIRQIGHRLLLQAGDHLSRVLPVTQVSEGTFRLTFEKSFFFSHDSLIAMADEYFTTTAFPSGYTVIVEDCMKAGIVYGFEVTNTSGDKLPCQGRQEPFGCYTIDFTFPDFYASNEDAETDFATPSEEGTSAKPAVQELKAKLKKMSTTKSTDVETIDVKAKPEIAVMLKPVDVEDPKSGELKATADTPLLHVVYGSVLLVLTVTLLFGRFGKTLKPGPTQEADNPIKDPQPELNVLGKFKFDVKGQRLLLADEVIALTDKESKILHLLTESFGELISRDTLMEKVWINEGVITSRSLDMFVSKLRKKLSADPELRITNVHGKGYRLEGASQDS